MQPINEIRAQMLLMECSGDEIWSIETCRERGVPENWIEELRDCFESGFDTDRNTIYVQDQRVNQYEGVLDLHLAYKLAEFLGIDWQRVTRNKLGRRAEVQAIQEAMEEE